MKTPSLHDRIAAPRKCVNCKVRQARPDSLYCSDRCKQAFLCFGEEKR